MKDSFGFIERADIVAEIFFHYSEFQGDIRELMIGDDVKFGVQQRKVCLNDFVFTSLKDNTCDNCCFCNWTEVPSLYHVK